MSLARLGTKISKCEAAPDLDTAFPNRRVFNDLTWNEVQLDMMNVRTSGPCSAADAPSALGIGAVMHEHEHRVARRSRTLNDYFNVAADPLCTVIRIDE